MADEEKPIKPLHGKLVTVIEDKKLYDECIRVMKDGTRVREPRYRDIFKKDGDKENEK